MTVINVVDDLSRWSDGVLRASLPHGIVAPLKKPLETMIFAARKAIVCILSNPQLSAIACLPNCGAQL